MIVQNQQNLLHTRIHGERTNGKVLLYLHGLGESGLCFENIITHPDLADWQHIVPDLPGYGKTFWPQNPLTLEQHAAFVNQWIEKNKWDSVILVGHSMGGVLGTLLYEYYPEHIHGFVNIEGNISLGDCVYSSQAASQSLSHWLETGFKKFHDNLFQLGNDDSASRGYFVSVRICDPKSFYQNSQDLVHASKTRKLAARFANLKIPGIYIGGVPRGIAPVSRELLSEAGVAYRTVENAGHWPFIDQPDHFIKIMSEFLSQFNL